MTGFGDQIRAIGRDFGPLLRSLAKDAADPAPKQRDSWELVTGKPGRWPEVLDHAKAIANVTPWTVQDVAEGLVTLVQLGWTIESVLTTPVDVWADLSGSSTAYDAARLWDAIRRTGEHG